MSRSLEAILCLAGGLLALPFFALACLVVHATLGRPILFSQVRAGRHGTPFTIRKLRTMSDERDAEGLLLPDAARQTSATALLRRLRLDEVPQLVEILSGRMALVGPRPLLPETIMGFGAAGRLRNTVRPGLTGWAQVSGNTALSDTEKLDLDLWYIAHRSAALDLRILAETVAVAILGERRRPDRIERASRWRRNALPADGALA